MSHGVEWPHIESRTPRGPGTTRQTIILPIIIVPVLRGDAPDRGLEAQRKLQWRPNLQVRRRVERELEAVGEVIVGVGQVDRGGVHHSTPIVKGIAHDDVLLEGDVEDADHPGHGKVLRLHRVQAHFLLADPLEKRPRETGLWKGGGEVFAGEVAVELVGEGGHGSAADGFDGERGVGQLVLHEVAHFFQVEAHCVGEADHLLRAGCAYWVRKQRGIKERGNERANQSINRRTNRSWI